MKTYQPGVFKDIFYSEIGQSIWNYLNSEDAKIRLVLTTQLGHPAAEGVGDMLLQKTGKDIMQDRAKQATGHMIRFVMESLGYVHDKRSVPCRKKREVFRLASRYKLSDPK